MNREELLKIAKPILFNTEMTQAILEDRKSATRRVVKPRHKNNFISEAANGKPAEFQMVGFEEALFIELAKPKYEVGDNLYVRETSMIQSMKAYGKKVKMLFKADDKLLEFNVSDEEYERLSKWALFNKWLSPYWTTKETARLFLKVTDVRVERLQDITGEQCRKEGIHATKDFFFNKYPTFCGELERNAFEALWNSTVKNSDDKVCCWSVNPWVFVIEFERLEVDEDR